MVDDPVDAVVVRLGCLSRLRRRRGVEVGSVDEVLRGKGLNERSDALVHGSLHVTCAKDTRSDSVHDSIDSVSIVELSQNLDETWSPQ